SLPEWGAVGTSRCSITGTTGRRTGACWSVFRCRPRTPPSSKVFWIAWATCTGRRLQILPTVCFSGRDNEAGFCVPQKERPACAGLSLLLPMAVRCRTVLFLTLLRSGRCFDRGLGNSFSHGSLRRGRLFYGGCFL